MISPCVRECKIDKQTHICRGCGRSIEEIQQWSKYTDDQRMVVMKRLGYGKREGREEKLRKYTKG